MKQYNEAIKYLENMGYEQLNSLYFLKNNPTSEVYIYNEDIQNGVIIRGYDSEFYYIATNNSDFLSKFWDYLPSGHIMFSGVPIDTALKLQKNKQLRYNNLCKVYVLTGSFLPIANNKYIVEPLVVSDAKEVDKYYTYRHEGSDEGFRHSIKTFDSSCVRINGELAAWCLVHEDGSLGPLYTKEEFRRRGLAEIVASDLMQKLIAKGHTPFVQIVEGNMSSLNLVSKVSAMTYTHDCDWFSLEKQ